MTQAIPKIEISDNEKIITYIDRDGIVKWTVGAPTLGEWQRLGRGLYTEKAFRQGVFRWVNGIAENDVIVVFSPCGGLDLNLTYSISNANLLTILEAR